MKGAPSVLILGGFGEGRHQIAKLGRALARDGFVLTKNLAQAEVIVAHSGGAYLLLKDANDKIVLMVNPPCGYRSWLRSARHKVKQDFHFHRQNKRLRHFLHKSFWNFWYVSARANHTVRMAKRKQEFAVNLPQIQARKVVVIVTKDDPWAADMPVENIAKNPSYVFLGMDGPHDDLWIHPQRYADVLKYLDLPYES